MKQVMMLAFTVLALGGCGRQSVQCTAASAQEPVVGIVKDQLEKDIKEKLRDADSGHSFSASKIRAAIAQLVIAIEDIRTSKEDPNSTKRFCSGTLKIRFATELLNDAQKAREAASLPTISDLADSQEIERNADSFSTAIDFNVQPTDDGSKVFAETESGNNMFSFASEIVASAIMRSAIEDTKRQEQAAADAQTAAQDAALTEQKNANLAVAKTDNQLAAQAILEVWRSFDEDTRARLLPQQRAWIRKKEADCRVEAASASIDPTAMDTARLTCDTRMTQQRMNWLQPYRSEGTAPEEHLGTSE